MTASLPSAQDVARTLDFMEADIPALRDVLGAFRPLKTRQAELRDTITPLEKQPFPPDAGRLIRGVPLTTPGGLFLSPDPAAYLRRAADTLMPALEEGFPALLGSGQAIRSLLDKKGVQATEALKGILDGRRKPLEDLARDAGLPAPSLEFILLQLVKPLLEKRSAALVPQLESLSWRQGICPVCGSQPEMAYLEGEGGRRRLICSVCAHHWRFPRTVCPVCGNEDHQTQDYFYAEGRERERVDVCRSCGKYLVTLDIRGMAEPPAWPVAGLGLVHLDIIAQEEGLAPAARTAWNIL